MQISFSIIITFYKKNKFLEKCLKYIDQFSNSKIDFDVILISEIKYKPKKYNYKLRFIHTPHLNRPGEKRNFAARISNKSILAFIDDDAYPTKKWLEKAFNFYLKKKKLNVCLGGPGLIPHDDNFQAKTADKFFTSKIFYPFSERYKNEKKKNLKYVNDWPAVNLFIPKKIFFHVKVQF